MARRRREINLPAPYLKRVWLDTDYATEKSAYPFCLPLFRGAFAMDFTRSITVIVGENGTGKSTLLEGIAAMAGYDDVGGGKGYRPIDHTGSVEMMGGLLGGALRASWFPKITTGWFFKAESFFTVARYLDRSALEALKAPPDFLSHSHGEGFLRFFEERCNRQGIFIFDEPESALSPSRQIQFLRLLRRMDESQKCQVIMTTHAPILMAYPGAQLLLLTNSGLSPTSLEKIEHFKLTREFVFDPHGFIEAALREEE